MIKNKKTRKNGKRITKRGQTKKSRGMIGGKLPKPTGGQPPKGKNPSGQPYKHFDTQKIENIHKSVQSEQFKHLRTIEERATRHLDKLDPEYVSKAEEILKEFHHIKSTAPVLSYGQKKDLLATISATLEKNKQLQGY